MLFGTVVFWIPALVSIGMMIGTDGGVESFHRIVPLWFVLALLAQLFGMNYSQVWVAGVIAQTALALYLAAREKLHR